MVDAETDTDWAALPPFPRAEHFLATRAQADLPMLAMAEEVSDILGKVMQSFDLRPMDEPDDEWHQTKALIYLGMIGGRSVRVIMLLLSYGYEAEALPFYRRLSEVHARVQRVTDERNGGQRARDWLQGCDRGASSVVELPEGAWHHLSHPAHADYRAAEQHLVVPREDGLSNFALLPLRNPVVGNATLAMASMELRDIAHIIATFKGLQINGLAELDARLMEASEAYVNPEVREVVKGEDEGDES